MSQEDLLIELAHRTATGSRAVSYARCRCNKSSASSTLAHNSMQSGKCTCASSTMTRIYIDLADKQWRAVAISPGTWRVVTRPAARFRRAKGMLPLTIPIAGGSIETLRKFIEAQMRRIQRDMFPQFYEAGGRISRMTLGPKTATAIRLSSDEVVQWVTVERSSASCQIGLRTTSMMR
jgi:hypothetical protein